MLQKYILLFLLSGNFWNYLALSNNAQIIPDNTLGQENSVVVPQTTFESEVVDYIEGGAIRNNNLFHSFSEFNIPDRGQAYFDSPTGIDNIITRITGNNSSNIFGTLGVDGGANLFLLNPNGIVFGQNSQLDVAGSFLATTADSYIFNNDFNYSASHPEAPPLLTIDIPVGLQFGSNVASIINRSRTLLDRPVIENNDIDSFIIPEGLRIAQGQNLSLIGGEIILEGGYLNVSEGKVELGAVEAENKIGLVPQENNWSIDYTEVNSFADIQIKQEGGIDGGSNGGSQIRLTGKNISLGYDLNAIKELGYETADFFSLKPLSLLDELPPNSNHIVAFNQDNSLPSQISINASNTFSIIDPFKQQQNLQAHTSGFGDAGDIEIISNSIILYGASIESWALAEATGNSGTIDFVAQNMSVQYGGGGVNTYGLGNGGEIYADIEEDINIQFGGFGAEVHGAGDGGTIQVDATNLEIRSAGIGVGTFNDGNGGIINLKITDNLKVFSGGFGADTLGKGDGGSIKVDAQNIELVNAGMGVNARDRGKGGNISVTAGTILLKDGIIGAESGTNPDERNIDEQGLQKIFNQRNAGDGGNIFVKAQNILISNGNISTTTVGTGNAGNIELQAGSFEAVGVIDSELLTGVNRFTDGSGSGGRITIDTENFELSNGATVAANSTDIGQAGDIAINSVYDVKLFQEGSISVDGGIDGTPGNINLTGQDIIINRNSIISASTTQGKQGNITIYGDRLFLSDRSKIITDATQDATGGNISINLQDSLIGLNNSQITAKAIEGEGGNIKINTKGLFFSADSLINASSEFGVDGLIEVHNFSVDPNSGLIQLPVDPINANLYLSQGCSRQQQHEFISVGRGGLPENPLKNVAQNIFVPDLGIDAGGESTLNSEFPTSVFYQISPIVEAQNWKVDQQGKVVLTANVEKSNIIQNQVTCLK